MPPTVLAHGIVGRQDLPLPFPAVVTGAAVALVVSFAALGLLWSRPRLRGTLAGRPVPAGLQRVLDAVASRWAVRIAGLVVCGWFLAAAAFGKDVDANPFPRAVFALLWVGLVPASVLLGPVWQLVNPLRTVHALLAAALRTPPEEGVFRLSKRVGVCPAALGLFAFVWLELAAPNRATLPVLRAWFGVYAGILLIGASVVGSSWFRAADPFEAWSRMFGRFSVLGRRADGRLVLRNPLDGVAGLRVEPGIVAVVTVMLGSTAWDSLSGSTRWVGWAQQQPHRTLVDTLGLLGCLLVVGGAFVLATRAAGWVAGRSGRELPGAFAHSLVPIALGYVVAHYYSFLIFQGQYAVILATDPLVTGADVLGLRGASISSAGLGTRTVASVQAGSVVAGHVLGVVLAHDRAVALFPRRTALAGQLPLLALMVCYTVGGLLLLFSA